MMFFSQRTRLLTTTLFLPMIFMAAGCLETKQHSVIVRFSEDGKKIELVLVYEGLFVGENPFVASPGQTEEERRQNRLNKAKEQLSEFVGSESQFSLLFLVDLKSKPDDSTIVAKGKRLMLKNIDIRNIAFLLNEHNELSGYQTITIDIQGFENAFNDVASEILDESVTEELSKPRDQRTDEAASDEFLRSIQRASRKGHKWIRITPGKITAHVPVSMEDAKEARIKFEKNKDSEILSKEIRKVFGDFRLMEDVDGLTLVVGNGSKKYFYQSDRRVIEKPLYEGELFTFARTLRVPFDRTHDTKSIIDKYLNEKIMIANMTVVSGSIELMP